MASDDYLKKEGVQIADINKAIEDIFEIYKNFYEGHGEGDIQRKREIDRPDCKYMKEKVKSPWQTGSTGIPYATKKRYDDLAKHLIRRVKRRDFIGFLEKGITHKIAKAFRTNAVDASTSALFLTIDVASIVLDTLFAGLSFSVGTQLAKGVEGAGALAIKLPIDLSILVGQDVLGVLVDGKIEFVGEKIKGKVGQQEHKKKGGTYKSEIAEKLKSLDQDDSKALFKILGRVYKFYIPKINAHFRQCHYAYEDLFNDIFKNDKEPENDADLEEKKPEFKTCDDLVKFTKKVYRLYHEIYKLRQYMMPMLRFMNCIAAQADIWQKFWKDNQLWETKTLIEKLKEFDDKKHDDCRHVYLCYGPHKVFIESEYSSMAPASWKVGPNIKIDKRDRPHHELDPIVRSPWMIPFREKLEYCERKNRKTWHKTWTAEQKEKDRKKKENKKRLKNNPELKKRAKEIKESQREFVLNDKRDRVARFVSAAQKSVDAKEDDIARRFQALVTDVGLFTEYRGFFGGKWRWAKHYFFNVKSKTKTTFNIVVLGAGLGIGVTIVVVTEVATLGLATPVAAGIGAGVALVWGTLKFGSTKFIDWIVDKVEGKYDKDALEKGKNWYGTKISDKRRMRINRNADASAKVISHCLSSIKNYKRLKYFRPNNNLANINDCDELAQYLWSVYKLQHHAWKTVEYNRPMLDFVMTCANNLEKWEKRFNNHIERCMKYCYEYLDTPNDHKLCYKSHIKSCGKSYRSKAIRLMRQIYNKVKKSNTFNVDCRKSRFCYGPKTSRTSAPTTVPYKCVLRPMDLRVDVVKKGKKRKKIRERLELMKQGQEQPATQQLNHTQIVIDDEEE
ncbi:MAG: hypothetical protein ACYSUX_06260 [Planctomycetota bacterium]|jgi:hypothetical protein